MQKSIFCTGFRTTYNVFAYFGKTMLIHIQQHGFTGEGLGAGLACRWSRPWATENSWGIIKQTQVQQRTLRTVEQLESIIRQQ